MQQPAQKQSQAQDGEVPRSPNLYAEATPNQTEPEIRESTME